METGIKITFGDYRQLPSDRDGLDFLFHFTMVDTKYIDAPEEFRMVEPYNLVVGISGTLQAIWRLERNQLIKTLFEYGKRHIIEKVKDGTITSRVELQLATSNAPEMPPFDTNRIPEPKGFELIVKIDTPNLSDNRKGLKIGGDIVDILDNINAIFHDKFGYLLFVPREFRATLELVRPANTKEEYIVRVISLAQLINQLNISALRDLTKENDTQVKSIMLLERFLTLGGGKPERAVQIIRAIVRLRQGYPVHTDTADGVREAHQFLSIRYPVTDYEESWNILLNQFLEALKIIKDTVERHPN